MHLAVVTGPDPGHAFPAVALALRLRDRGHSVVVATGDRWGAAISGLGLRHVPLPLLAPDPRDADFGFVLWGRGQAMAPPLAALLSGVDAVVADTLTVAGWFAADLLGVPRVELVPHLLPVLPRGVVARRLHAGSVRRGLAQRAAARAAIGLPFDSVPAARLVATLPALESSHPVVGPLEWDPASVDLMPPDGDGPLVFVTDSSASGRPQSLLSAAVAGLNGLGVLLACTRFGSVADDLPPWAVAGPGRQAPLLDRSAVVVCTGGHGMVAKALSRGLPLVIVPGPGDQGENASRVAGLGAGVVVRSPTGLGRAVRRVLEDPAYAAAACRAADSLSAVPPDRAVELVEAVVRA